MRHLAKWMHDVVAQPTEIWCASEWSARDVVEDVEAADCEECLLAAFHYGLLAMRRRIFLKDGRLVQVHEQIEKMLHDLSTPVLFVHEAKKP